MKCVTIKNEAIDIPFGQEEVLTYDKWKSMGKTLGYPFRVNKEKSRPITELERAATNIPAPG